MGMSKRQRHYRAIAARRERLIQERGFLHSSLEWLPSLASTGGWTLAPDTRRLLQRWITRAPP